MNELSHNQLSAHEIDAPKDEWDEINHAAFMIAEGMALENITGSTDDRIALVKELDSLYDAYAPYISSNERPYLISAIETPVVAQTTFFIRQEVESGRATNNLVHKIRDVPFGLNTLAVDLQSFVGDALLEQKKAMNTSSKHERDDVQYQADALSSVAANYGLNIPGIDEGMPSGSVFKTEQVNRLLRQANRLRDKDARKTERDALEAFVAAGYDKQVRDFETLPSRVVSQLNSLFENRSKSLNRIVAATALFGVAGPVLSATVAHAAPPAVNNDNRNPAPDMTRNLNDKNSIRAISAVSEQKSNSQSLVADEKAVKVQQNTIVRDEDDKKDNASRVIARVGARTEGQPAKSTSSSLRIGQDGRTTIIASPGVRAAPEKLATPPVIQKNKDGQSVIIAKKDETRRDRVNIVKVPLPATPSIPPVPETAPPSPAPAPEAPAPAPEQGPYQLNAEQNGIIDSLNLSASKKDFLREVAAGAITLQQRGSKVNPEVMIAQAVLESGWGESKLAKVYKNYFGTKAGSTWQGKTIDMLTEEVYDGQRSTENATWPVFESAEECFNEYEKFITNLPHFADALEHTNNPEGYVRALLNGNLKYATDPIYETKILGTIKANHLSQIVNIAKNVQAEKAAADQKAAAEAKAAADAAAAAEAAKNAITASQREKVVEDFTGWHHPVPVGSPLSPQYPGHKGYDYAVGAGTPFYAAMGGTVEVLEYNVKDEQFCKDAFRNIGASMDIIKDPIQKEVRITRMIGNDKYEVIYAHMSQIDVKDGQIVNGNDVIGKSGNSGCSTGDHAHVEIRINGVSVDLNVLFIQGKVQPMGSVEPSSADTPDTELGEQCHGEGGAGCACGCGGVATEATGEQSEIAPQPAGSSVSSTEQERWLEAVKKAADLKTRTNGQPATDEGYMSVAH